MKKFLIFLFVLFVMPAFAGAFDMAQNKIYSEEQNKLAQELNSIKEDTCDLYGLVEKELLNYYGKHNIKDFYDPEHRTGWFRVYDFLSWLKENEKELVNKISAESNNYNYYHHNIYLKHPLKKYCSLKTAETKGFLGTFLGREYLLSKYSAKIVREKEYFMIKANTEASAYIVPKEIKIPTQLRGMLPGFPKKITLALVPTILYEKSKKVSFINLVNSSMHETMHLIGVLTMKYQDLLPEMFTTYVQMAYALPIKPEEGFSSGVRDLYRAQKVLPEESKDEYTDAFFAYIQFKHIEKMNLDDIISFSKKLPDFRKSAWDDIVVVPQFPEFFLGLLEIHTGEYLSFDSIRNNDSIQIIYEEENIIGIKQDSLTKWYSKISSMNYISEIIFTPINIDELLDNMSWVFPEYRKTVKELAEQYIKINLDALYKESDFNKSDDISRYPLKYILKENKDIPPTPEGYI